ncbi:uncharacterized protein LOC107262296 [Ricinus communis]|uniref:uncharacterized protein LOC107262296 n=1 Tax=Ricinus communis TaxID=3988 RepID=UPI00077251F8|nr:uncharacterized protein LOC107262296 [Ricinus communis]|eukprot:XP_015582789.1 uncharacterized protein LOC107262296 [Ricinus communis]
MHHQIIYRLQDRAFNLQIPGFQATFDALFIMADSGQVPTIVQTPRQLEREDLQKLIPTEWVTNYEKLHASQAKLVQATDPLFVTQKDGTVKIIFTKIEESSSALSIFQASMIQPVSRPREKIPIHSFQSSGHHIYTARIKGHFIWDIDPEICEPGCTCKDDLDFAEPCSQHPRKTSRAMYPETPCLVKKPRQENYSDLPAVQAPQIIQNCFMFQPEDFPPLGNSENKRSKITPSKVTSSGTLEPLTPPEEVLNWQTSNSIVQNSYLKKIRSSSPFGSQDRSKA